jgi:hypothetical protein
LAGSIQLGHVEGIGGDGIFGNNVAVNRGSIGTGGRSCRIVGTDDPGCVQSGIGAGGGDA